MNTKIKYILIVVMAGLIISGCDVSDPVAVNTTDTCKIKFLMVHDSVLTHQAGVIQRSDIENLQK